MIMGYRKTVFVDECYYHVYSRGNEKRDVFLSDKDYSRFMSRLNEYSKVDKVEIICFCLMPNHYHLILKQLKGGSITNFTHRLQVSYAMYFNIKNDRVGHLFQGPFKAKLIEGDEYLLQVSRYIHLNPKEIGKDPIKYKWSSLKNYLNLAKDSRINKRFIYDYFDSGVPAKDYKNFVFSSEEVTSEDLF